MLRVNKILLPVDFSERSNRAARYALPFLAHYHAEAIVLHVLPPHYEFSAVDAGGAVLGDLIAERRA